MADIKPLSTISKKWTDVTPGRATEYQAGVENPSKSWSAQTAAAESSYNEGVQAAISAGRFGKGVSSAGDAAWKKGAVEKGVSRWPQGVRISGPAYQAGFAPYHAVISGVTLPPKGPKGDPRNYERVAAIGQALHSAKVGA